jgi:hypothetical protein
MERDKRIHHRSDSDQSEHDGGDPTGAVAEVEEAHGETAEDDSKVQPGEEGAFVGEEDFGFDAGGEGDALAC